jgi:hypothetical protein
MKKLFIFLITVLCFCAGNKMMSQVVASGITGDCTWTLTGTPDNYNLTIIGIGVMADYTLAIAVPWYNYQKEIKTVDLQQGITAIGNNVFINCNGLTSVTVPNSVTTIGEGAFSYCSSLKTITIPNSVITIGEGTFEYCSSLTAVIIPNSVTDIGDYTFWGCSGLVSVIIPDSVITIGDYAFSGCSRLSSVTIGFSVTTIGEEAFAYCSKLTSLSVKAVEPPQIFEKTFHNVSKSIPVYVCGLENYKKATYWDSFTNMVEDCLDVKDISLKHITLFPNPATDYIHVVLPENVHRAVFTLYDMQGKILTCQVIGNQETVSINKIPAGIYIYDIRTEKQSYQGKIVISD